MDGNVWTFVTSLLCLRQSVVLCTLQNVCKHLHCTCSHKQTASQLIIYVFNKALIAHSDICSTLQDFFLLPLLLKLTDQLMVEGMLDMLVGQERAQPCLYFDLSTL